MRGGINEWREAWWGEERVRGKIIEDGEGLEGRVHRREGGRGGMRRKIGGGDM